MKRGDKVRVKETCRDKEWIGKELEVTMPDIPLTYSDGVVSFCRNKNGREKAFFLEDLEILEEVWNEQ